MFKMAAVKRIWIPLTEDDEGDGVVLAMMRRWEMTRRMIMKRKLPILNDCSNNLEIRGRKPVYDFKIHENGYKQVVL